MPDSETMASSTASSSTSSSAAAPDGASSASATLADSKLIVPDLSALTAMQKNNIALMTEATETASKGLQDIVKGQQQALESSIKNLQSSMTTATGTSGLSDPKMPQLSSEIENLNSTITTMNKAADDLTKSMTKSFATLNSSVNETLTQIEAVTKQFSSGG